MMAVTHIQKEILLLGSNKCHNTVEFDGRDQMKKVPFYMETVS